MARADHDAAVKIIRTDDVGHARRRRHVHEIGVCARGRQAGGQGIFKHIAGSAGIFADHDRALVLPAVIPAEKPADPVGVLHRQAHVGLTAEAVCAEIFAHHKVDYPVVGSPSKGTCLLNREYREISRMCS